MMASIEHREAELVRELDAHDALVHRCVDGELTWDEFETAYENFYPRHPLDGHESDPEHNALLAKYAKRIALHEAIWEQVLTRVTSHAGAAGAAAGFIEPAEAVRRLRELVDKHRDDQPRGPA